MTTTKKVFFKGIIWMTGLGLPLVSLAEGGFSPSIPFWGPLLKGVCNDGGICSNLCELFRLGQNVIYFGLTILLFAIGPTAFIIGGIMILTAGGSEDRMKKGRRVITAAVLGIAIGLGAFLIINTFLGLIGGSLGTGEEGWARFSCEV